MVCLSARSVFTAGLLSAGLFALPGLPALSMSYTVLAYPGMSVPVPGEDLVIQQVFPPGFLGSDAAPVINANGDIAFWTELEQSVGGANFGDAVWSYKGGALAPVAVAGDAVPGIAGATFRVNLSRRVILDNAGNIALGAELDTPSGFARGMFVGGTSPLRTVVADGQTVPQVDPLSPAFGFEFDGLGFGGNFLSAYAGDDFVFNANNLAFSARIADPNSNAAFNPALYVERDSFAPSGLDLIARSGNDTSFFPQARVAAVSSNGEAMFRTTVTPNDSGNFTAIATYNQADISYIARSGSDAGGDLSFTGGFTTLPGFNAAGQAAFVANLSEGSGSGLFKSQDPDGIVAMAGIVAAGTPDLNDDGTPDFVFRNFSSSPPLINANGNVVFVHAAQTPDGSQSVTGMWTDRTGPLTALEPIAFIGDQAPGMPEGYVFTSLALQGVERSVVFNANDQVAFMGQVQGPTGPIRTGLWAEVNGELTLIAVGGIGQTIDLPNGSTITVSGVDFMGGSGNQDGRPSGFSDNGQVVARIDGGGNNSAYVLFSPFAILQGDTDGDGDVDDTDLGTMFSNYTGPVGVLGGKNLSLGDTDGDGDVDDTDLGTAFVNYTGPLGPGLGDSVPEPASVVLLMIGGSLSITRRS
ncbi:MAG: choice-of-anchor tandem repeat NxxGxxAF-containing protein [Phycisphaeraceae bacterium]